MSERKFKSYPGGQSGAPEIPWTAIARPADEFETERVQWLSEGRLAFGKITVLDGDPGLGKSTITLDWAARISRGLPLPGSRTQPDRPRGVIILSAEDGAGDTIRPRLEAAGADLSRVYLLAMRDGLGHEQLPDLSLHIRDIGHQVEATDAALVIIDPLMAFLGGDVNSNRDQDIRRVLSPVAAMADQTHCAVLILRHLNKASGISALYRGGGSIGIIGAARFGLIVGKDPDCKDGSRRVLAVQKCNIGPEAPALIYGLASVPDTDVARVQWLGESNITASQLTAGPMNEEERSGLDTAMEWLEQTLAEGPMWSKDVQRECRDAGLSWRTIEAAKKRLKVDVYREGYAEKGKWFWRMPSGSSGGADGATVFVRSYDKEDPFNE